MDSNQRFSTAQKGRESARQSRAAAQLRNPAPYSREGIRKRLEDGSEYDDVLITEDYTKLKDFALESGFISKEEAGKIASHKADRVAALIAEDIDKAKTIRSKLLQKIETCEHNTEFFSEHDVCPSCNQDIAEGRKSKWCRME